jgi:alkylhydroperoxidase family enzyme
MTNWTLCWLLLTPMAEPQAGPPITRSEIKETLEQSKESKPRLPIPPSKDGSSQSRVNNGWFRSYYLPADLRDGGFAREPEPAMTLDNTWKVKLFWITSRANDCRYCLGHQEHKLASAGVSDDDIGILDGDWSEATAKDRAAFQFTRKLAIAPNSVSAADVEELKKHFTPLQVLEILVTDSGYNATNRWTGPLNIPAEKSGAFFKKEGVKADLDSFVSPTSAKFARLKTSVAPIGVEDRPAFESREEVLAKWKENRVARFPLADVEIAKKITGQDNSPGWIRLLANFPIGMKGRIVGLKNAIEKGNISPRLKAEIAWVAARNDRAWYALHLAHERLKAIGFTEDQIFALDGDRKSLPESEQAALNLAQKIMVSPWKVTDETVERVRKQFSDSEVAEIIYHTCNAAFLDRVTEVANLPFEKN